MKDCAEHLESQFEMGVKSFCEQQKKHPDLQEQERSCQSRGREDKTPSTKEKPDDAAENLIVSLILTWGRTQGGKRGGGE